MVFNLDSSVSNDQLRQIFGVYGEIKEVRGFLNLRLDWNEKLIGMLSLWANSLFSGMQVRETPHRSHHKFVEFYDIRAAEAALRALNRSDIGGKQIKLEPSLPGGARRWVFLSSNGILVFFVCMLLLVSLSPVNGFNLLGHQT